MKIPAGFPFFDHPGTHKVTAAEHGNFFVPTEGVDKEATLKEGSYDRAETGKWLKTGGVILVIAAFAALIIWAILDPGPKTFYRIQ